MDGLGNPSYATDNGRRECLPHPTHMTFAQEAMAAEFRLTLVEPDPIYARQAAAAAFAELEQIENRLSRYVETSDLFRINRLEPRASHNRPRRHVPMPADRLGGPGGDRRSVRRGLCVGKPGRRRPRPGDRVNRSRLHGSRAGRRGAARPRRHWQGICPGSDGRSAGGMGHYGGAALCQHEHGVGPGRAAGRAGLGRPPRGGSGRRGVCILPTRPSAPRAPPSAAPTLSIPARVGRRKGRFRAWAIAPTAAEADALSTAFMVMSEEEVRDYCRRHPEVSAHLLQSPEAVAQSETD